MKYGYRYRFKRIQTRNTGDCYSAKADNREPFIGFLPGRIVFFDNPHGDAQRDQAGDSQYIGGSQDSET